MSPWRRRSDAARPVLAQRYGEAVRAADVALAEQVVDEALGAGLAAPEIQSEVIHPAMWWIGELWERAELTVADEHLATAISQQALIRLYPALQVAPSRSRPGVLVAAVEGQQHTLGLRMVADVLEGAGFDVLYLGANVPTASLVEMVRTHEPAVTALGCSFAAGGGALVDALLGIYATGAQTRLLIGGHGVPLPLRDAGIPWLGSSIGVVDTVDELLAHDPVELPKVVRELAPAVSGWGPIEQVSEEETRLLGIVEEATERSRRYARHAQEYRYLALHDPVTGMFNRRAFDDRLQELAEREATDALIAIDLDRFKAVNDTHGHDAGDELLRDVGKAIGDALRPGDFAARTGGDEFAVLLPDCPHDVAVEVAERIRTGVAAANVFGVTASMGVVGVAGEARVVMLAADSALYAAKQAGRDRVSATER